VASPQRQQQPAVEETETEKVSRIVGTAEGVFDWGPGEVCRWLKHHLNLPTDFLKRMEFLEIDGETLLEMNEQVRAGHPPRPIAGLAC
jgi:hypothetical protein